MIKKILKIQFLLSLALLTSLKGGDISGFVHDALTGESIIVPDTAKSPYFYQQVDEQAKYETKNMLDVPMRIQNRFIGVLCAVNKEDSEFDHSDVSVLSTIAGMVALPIENARINDELNHSYEEVKSLNRAKDRVIHHLSHELKTPVAVLSASLGLLQKKQFASSKKDVQKILDRAQRNLQRILEMQYEIEDILREKDFTSYQLLKHLLEACTDELETLAMDEFGSTEAVKKIRRRIEDLFGPKDLVAKRIRLDRFVKKHIESLQPRFSHRDCELITNTNKTADIFIPEDVLAKEGIMDEKKIMARFFDLLAKKPGMASYGEKEVMTNLKNGVVDVLLLSEELEDEKMEKFEEEAKAMGTTVNIISTETREGVQLRDIGKVAGILRYEVQ